MWTKGRQHSGYDKLKIIAFPPYCDAWLLRYPEGSSIPPHRDPVPGRKHYRINFTLSKAAKGGQFVCDNVIFQWGRLAIFRSDLNTHSVTEIQKGRRYALSLGISTKDSE